MATSVRVCRGCHNDFPSEYCDQDSRIIALVGAKASGKSTYVSVLVNELRGRVGREYNISLPAMGAETQRRDREMEEDLYERLRLPDTTRPAAMGFNDPLLYRLSVPRRGRYAKGSRHTTLVFFDAAGEDLKSAEAMARYTQYLAAADGSSCSSTRSRWVRYATAARPPTVRRCPPSRRHRSRSPPTSPPNSAPTDGACRGAGSPRRWPSP